MSIKRCVMAEASMRVMKTAMDEREAYVNTMEGFWSLLRSWLRPHRGISQEKLSLYLGFFEFVYNAKKRGKAMLTCLVRDPSHLAPWNPYWAL